MDIKKFADGFKKTVQKIIKIGKSLLTTVGQIIALAILLVFIVIVTIVSVKAIGFSITENTLKEEFAGISSDADYEYIISSFADAGYDALISEKTYQEFLSYEYSVLMDVADYLYEIQEKSGDLGSLALPVLSQYDISKSDEATWRERVKSGQASARFEDQSILKNYLSQSSVGAWGAGNVSNKKLGSNKDVLPPYITFEFRSNANLGESMGSLVPYIYVLKEDIVYNYYSVGGKTSDGVSEPDGGRKNYSSGKYSSAMHRNKQNGALYIGDENISDINLLEFNTQLNGVNSAFTHSFTNAKNNMGSNGDFIAADGSYPVSLYSHDEYDATMYKIPLKLLIDRYLPKSILLSQWYLLKDKTDRMYNTDNPKPTETPQSEDAELFPVDELIKDIKNIYNYYCWGKPDEVIKQESGEFVEYDKFGAVIRSEDGSAILKEGKKDYATTNKDTFMHFGTTGLETNRFGLFSVYHPGDGSVKGPVNPSAHGGSDVDKTTIPIVTDLISKKGFFLDKFELEVEYDYDYGYKYDAGDTVTLPILDVQNIFYTVDVNSSNVGGPFEMNSSLADTYKNVTGKEASSNIIYSSSTKIISKTVNGGTYTFVYETVGSTVYATGKATTTTTIKYNRNEKYDVSELDKISAALTQGIELGHSMTKDPTLNPNLPASQLYSQEKSEHELINYMYYADENAPLSANGKTRIAQAKDMIILPYKHDIPIYYLDFSANSKTDDYKKCLAENIRKGVYQMFSGDNAELTSAVNEEFKEMYPIDPAIASEYQSHGITLTINGDTEPHLKPNMPSNATFGGIIKINSVKVKFGKGVNAVTSVGSANFDFDLSFLSAFEHEVVAHLVKEEIIALTLDISQQRMGALLVTDAQTWAKELTYSIGITQNIFDPTDYRYVVPHAFFGFGVVAFDINENAHYRVDFYKNYFSKYENTEPRIKEADVLEMLIEWEKLGMNGEETAYVLMRDLYKLIMCIRDSGEILGQNYSYLYLPETIWDFREGITQEAFWTEHLACKDDPLTAEEQKKLIVKKNEISWQIVDYPNYEECQAPYVNLNGETPTRLYALFPQGSPYLRTLYQEIAVTSGEFPDGGFKEGHNGADWSSRGEMSKILACSSAHLARKPEKSGDLYRKIYEYDLLSRTLKEILNSSHGDESKMNELKDALSLETLSVNPTVYGNAYNKAREKLNADLTELTKKSPIVAVAPGYVNSSRFNCYGGFCVSLIHSKGGGRLVKTSYSHMKRWPEVQTGDKVGAGTLLGYEGTTGNSGGYHLHMSISFNDQAESPSKYMAPIYTPFYNEEKVLEEQSRYKSFIDTPGIGEKMLLGSEYFSLIRTVLMARFDGDKLKTGSIKDIDPDSVFISECVTYRSGDAIYVEFSENPEIDVNGKIIINSGDLKKPDYWDLTVEEEVIPVKITAKPTSSSFSKMVRYKITNASNIDEDDIVTELNRKVKIKVGIDSDDYMPATIVWGNKTVPFEPMFEDYSDAMDVGELAIPKKFEVNSGEYIGYDDSDDANIREYDKNVRVTKDAFDIQSQYAKKRQEISGDVGLYLSDVDRENCVPLYDGPVSMEIYNAYVNGIEPPYLRGSSSTMVPGTPGTQLYDLERFQKILISMGLVPKGVELDVGNYDDAMVETVKSLWEYNGSKGLLRDQSQADPPIGKGQLGNVHGPGQKTATNNAKWFDIAGITAWETEMVFHSEEYAKETGVLAEEISAKRNSLPTPLMRGVGNCESMDNPLNESHAFLAGAEEYNFETEFGSNENIIHYNLPTGKFRAVRRALGLCQYAWKSALPRLAADHGITDTYEVLLKLKTAIFNAIYVGEFIADNVEDIVSNEVRKIKQNGEFYDDPNGEGLMDWVHDIAKRDAWQRLGEDTCIDPAQLVIWSAAVNMYRGGPNTIKQIDYPQGSHTISWAFENMEYDRNGTDEYGQPGYINLYPDQTGYTGRVLKIMYNYYMRSLAESTGVPWNKFSQGGNRLPNGQIAPHGKKPGDVVNGQTVMSAQDFATAYPQFFR